MINLVLFQFIQLFAAVFNLLLLLRVVMSWVSPDPYANRFTQAIYNVTEPLLAPIRRLLPSLGGIDLSPLVAFVVLQLLVSFALRLL